MSWRYIQIKRLKDGHYRLYKVVWRANHRWKHWETQGVKDRGQVLEFETRPLTTAGPSTEKGRWWIGKSTFEVLTDEAKQHGPA
jgi:hypothetical protein